MIKKLFVSLLLINFLPVFATELDDTLKKYDKVFLYFHAKDWGYCVKFNPYYNKLEGLYNSKNCKFLKIDAMSSEGNKIGQNFGVYYLPYVIMIDNNKRQIRNVVPKCLLNYACVKDATDKFVN